MVTILELEFKKKNRMMIAIMIYFSFIYSFIQVPTDVRASSRPGLNRGVRQRL